jgi:hypothetical protein
VRDLHVQIPEDLHRQLRLLTSITGATIRETVENALSEYLSRKIDPEAIKKFIENSRPE